MGSAEKHPPQEQLIAFGLGTLDPDAADQVAEHLFDCQHCSETIVNLEDDTFVSLVRKSRASEPVGDSPSDAESEATVDLASGSTESTIESDELPPELCNHSRYQIHSLIGKGGMGDVYKASHRMMRRMVALKIINRDLVQNSVAVDRFHREVQTAAHLSHPNIVAAYDAEQAGDIHFLAMEYVDGINLSQLVGERGPLPIPEACEYVRQAAIGLQYAHERGMVHRDIKPHNLMLTNDDTVKILDFGLASLSETPESGAKMTIGGGELTVAGSIMGTPDYMSPEQAQDARQADVRSDIYSLGATLYYLLSGRPPFAEGNVAEKLESLAMSEPESLRDLRADIPAELAAIVEKMMAKDPGERFQTPAEVAEALVRIGEALVRLGEDMQPTESPKDEPEVKPSWLKSQFLPLTAIAALFFGMIAAGIVYYIQTNNGTVGVEVSDPSLQVAINGETITMRDGPRTLKIETGQKKLVVRQLESGFEFETDNFDIHRGDKLAFKVEILNGVEIVVRKDDKPFDAKKLPQTSLDQRFAGATDFQRIQGTWKVVSGSTGGSDLSENEIDSMQASYTFSGHTLVINHSILENDQRTEKAFRLDPTTNPKKIDTINEDGNVLRGIYEFRGDSLRICWPVRPMRVAPAKFQANSFMSLLTLQRVRQTASSKQFAYDLSRVPTNAREIYGFRPGAIHADGRFVSLWNALKSSPLAPVVDHRLAEVLSVKLANKDGTLMPPLMIMTVAEGNAEEFAFREFGKDGDIPEKVRPVIFYPARQRGQFYQVLDDKTICLGTRDALNAFGLGLVYLKREPNAELMKIAASMPDGPFFVIGNSRDKRFLEAVKQQGSKSPVGVLLMSHIPLWEDTSYLTLSLSMGDNPQLRCSAHALSPDKQAVITQTMKVLRFSLSNLLHSTPAIEETTSWDAMIAALTEAEVTEPSETESVLTVSLIEARPHLLKLLNSYLTSQTAKTAASKAASVNNLRQIGMAFIMFEQEHGYLPSVTTKIPGAKHPVSWRVAILKYLDEELYNQYKLDEPWYSDHNKKLLAKMPSFYRHPGQQKGITDTCYVTLVGENTATGNGETPLTDSYGAGTILITEAYTNIPWTKPEDHLVDDKPSLPARRPQRDGWNVIFVDGSAHFISSETPADELKALIERASAPVAEEIDLPKQAISPDATSLLWVDVQEVTWDKIDQSLDSLIDAVPHDKKDRAWELIVGARQQFRGNAIAWEKGLEAGMEMFVVAGQPSSYLDAEVDEGAEATVPSAIAAEFAESEQRQFFVRMRSGTDPKDATAVMATAYMKEWNLPPDSEAAQTLGEFKAMEFVDVGDGWFAAKGENVLPLPAKQAALDVTPFVRALRNHKGASIRFAWLMDDATRSKIDQAQLDAGARFFGGLMTSLRDMQSTTGGVWLGQQPKIVLDMQFADEVDAKLFKATLDKMVGLVGMIFAFGTDNSDDPEEALLMQQTQAALTLLFLDREGANLSKTLDLDLLQRLAAAGLSWTSLFDPDEAEKDAQHPLTDGE